MLLKIYTYDQNPNIQKYFATTFIVIYGLAYLIKIMITIFGEFSFSLIGYVQRHSIANAFFNKNVSQKFKDYNKQQLPLLISNTTLNGLVVLENEKEPIPKKTKNEDKYNMKSNDIFTLTPIMIGSDTTDYQEVTEKTSASIDKYVSISAAAISFTNGNMIKDCSLGRFFLQIQSLNLGAFMKIKKTCQCSKCIVLILINLIHVAYMTFLFLSLWLNDFDKKFKITLFVLIGSHILLSFIAIFRKWGYYALPIANQIKQSFQIDTYISEKSRNKMPDQIFLSDGGHFENLGLVPLLQRRCTNIIVVDGGDDSDLEMDCLIRALAIANEKYEYIEPCDLEKNEEFTDLKNKDSERKCICFEVKYKKNNDRKGIKKAKILYIKLKKNLGENSFNPYMSTANQFLNSNKTESYINLGLDCVGDAFKRYEEFFKEYNRKRAVTPDRVVSMETGTSRNGHIYYY